jgi:hypothetical protein
MPCPLFEESTAKIHDLVPLLYTIQITSLVLGAFKVVLLVLSIEDEVEG